MSQQDIHPNLCPAHVLLHRHVRHRLDPGLVNVDALFSQLGTHGLKVERDNLGQQSMGFLRNPSDVAGWNSSVCSGNDGHEQLRGASQRSYFWR